MGAVVVKWVHPFGVPEESVVAVARAVAAVAAAARARVSLERAEVVLVTVGWVVVVARAMVVEARAVVERVEVASAAAASEEVSPVVVALVVNAAPAAPKPLAAPAAYSLCEGSHAHGGGSWHRRARR